MLLVIWTAQSIFALCCDGQRRKSAPMQDQVTEDKTIRNSTLPACLYVFEEEGQTNICMGGLRACTASVGGCPLDKIAVLFLFYLQKYNSMMRAFKLSLPALSLRCSPKTLKEPGLSSWEKYHYTCAQHYSTYAVQ